METSLLETKYLIHYFYVLLFENLYYFLYLFMLAYTHLCQPRRTHGGQLAFQQVGSWSQTRVIRLSNNFLYRLNHRSAALDLLIFT